MKIPSNMSEKEVLEVIENVAIRLHRKFKFGYHSDDDIKQQARMYAWEGMEHYDESRPLENFLWTHVRNRLYNFKRNNYSRPEKPCDTCPFYNKESLTKPCQAFEAQDECSLYKGWMTRNDAKRNLMKSVSIEFEQTTHKENCFGTLMAKEFMDLIDVELPVHLREDWIRFINDLKLAKVRKNKLIEEIHKIMEENNIDKEAW